MRFASNTNDYDSNDKQSHHLACTVGYDTQNRLVLVIGTNLSANFTYDGDGRRVKSIINDVTTLFAGGHYEQTGNQVTKYYFAGATRIAVRTYVVSQSNTLYYLVGDQLGSTSLAIDASTGDVVTTKYKPCPLRFTSGVLREGKVRWTSENKTLPTRYREASRAQREHTFTGQYSYVSDDATDLGNAGFGLMFYNARWYDPMTGRMSQADSVVPGGVQGLDRFAYVSNNPIMYTDPSGHVNQAKCNSLKNYECEPDPANPPPTSSTGDDPTCGVGGCEQYDIDTLAETYDFHVKGEWTLQELDLLLETARDIESVVGSTKVMKEMFGAVTFEKVDELSDSNGNPVDSDAQTLGRTVQFDSDYFVSRDALAAKFGIAHELGHVWDNGSGNNLSNTMHHDLHSTFGLGGSPGKGPGATGWTDQGVWNPGEDFAQSFAAHIYPVYAEWRSININKNHLTYCPGGGYTYCYTNYRATPRGIFIAAHIPRP